MRGTNTIRRRIPNSNSFFLIRPTNHSHFSTSSGGRGRGGPSPFSNFDFTNQPESQPDAPESQPNQPGVGRGRGRVLTSNPTLPSFSSFISSVKNDAHGIGRGRGEIPPEMSSDEAMPSAPGVSRLPDEIHSSFSGAGRGKPVEAFRPGGPEAENRHMRPTPEPVRPGGQVENRHMRSKPEPFRPGGQEVENRHMRPKPKPEVAAEGVVSDGEVQRRKMDRGEAVAHAIRVLSVGSKSGRGGMVRGGGRGRGGGRLTRERGQAMEEEDDEGGKKFLQEVQEELTQRVGVENMTKLVEASEEAIERVIPSPLRDAYLDALDTNFKIEFEEEYLMEEFDKNPELDEKEAMPVRDMLEKLKPFLMAYEGYKSQKEWEEAVEATMKNVPLFNEIVEHYAGPERLTAKTQQEVLESVAKTIPPSAPASVKQFANRAMLSLQSNPGWGFDKKYQFMDKLSAEASRHYR